MEKRNAKEEKKESSHGYPAGMESMKGERIITLADRKVCQGNKCPF
jgi:hypothetical protein